MQRETPGISVPPAAGSFDGPNSPLLGTGIPTIVLPAMDEAAMARSSALADCQRQLQERARETALLESLLQARAADVEAARAARDAVLRNVSHELRTPLNHILGGVEVMMRADLDEKQTQWIGAIRRSAGDLLGMVNRLLDLARLQSDGMQLESVAFDPREVLDDVRVAARDRARAKGLEIVVLPSFTVPSTVVGSPTRLAQALLEYLDNAIKFTAHGRVTLSAQLLGTDARGHHLRFAVTDTGRGVDNGLRDKLFTPFVSGEAGNQRVNGSLGNGLAVVKAIARALGGDAGVESGTGAGSTFWLTGRFAPSAIPEAANQETPFDDVEPLPTPEPANPLYPTPHFVTLGDFDVDHEGLRGTFRVALDDLLLPERFHFSPSDTGWAEWVGPMSVFPEGGAREFPLYPLDADTEAAVSRALHSAVPRLVPVGRDPLNGEVRHAGSPATARAFDPARFADGVSRLTAPGFSVTVSTFP